MLLRLRTNETDAELRPLLELADELGYTLQVLDAGRRVAELRAEPANGASMARAGDRSRFEDLTCVERVLDSSDAPELTERIPGRTETIVRIGEGVFGGGNVSLIAGPCAVENEADVISIAHDVRAAGATVLRGGAFKPRTSPHSFQGLGLEGLTALVHAREATGLAFVTEVLDPRDVAIVAEAADAIQIGSRSMSNAVLLKEAAQSGRPILLKRGMAATVRELLLAAEYILASGNQQVLLCERGIRGFDQVTRNVLDLGAVAYLAGATHLPVIVDPSHAAGRADLVAPLAKAGIAAGAAGLIIEVHPRPEGVHSDGAQAITPEAFGEIAAATAGLAALDGRTLVTPGATPTGAAGVAAEARRANERSVLTAEGTRP